MSEILFQCGVCDGVLDAQVTKYSEAITVDPCERCKALAETQAEEEAEKEFARGFENGFEDGKLEGENHDKED